MVGDPTEVLVVFDQDAAVRDWRIHARSRAKTAVTRTRDRTPWKRADLTTVLRPIVSALAIAAAIAAGSVVAAPRSGAAVACASSYSYVGIAHGAPGRAVRATITPLAAPQVHWGHVAAWVGVGGPNQGANGSDAWIQVGFSGFYGGVTKLYYEVARPGAPPRYYEIDATPEIGVPRTLAVAEVAGHPSWWQVSVDGKPVGGPVRLPGSHGRWAPIATAESWNAGQARCNRFSYRFEGVAVATRRGWRTLTPGTVFRSPGYTLKRRAAGFVAGAR